MLAQLCLVIFKTFSLPWINYALFYLPHFQMWFNNETLFQARTNYGNALDLKRIQNYPSFLKLHKHSKSIPYYRLLPAGVYTAVLTLVHCLLIEMKDEFPTLHSVKEHCLSEEKTLL